MPRVREPESDQGRLQLLSKASVTAVFDRQQGLDYLPDDLPMKIGAFLNDNVAYPGPGPIIPGYRSAVQALTRNRAALSKEVDEAEKADATLEVWMRDFWEVLRRRTFRLGHSAAVLNFFDLSHDGTTPVTSNRADRYAWAQKIIDGEASAVAAGYPAMANPGAAEVAEKLAVAKVEAEQITPKDRDTELALEYVRSLRPRALELVADVLDALRYNLRKMEPSTVRDIMRSYGVEYESLPGETPADDGSGSGAGGTAPGGSGGTGGAAPSP